MRHLIAVVVLVLVALARPAAADRVKDLVTVEGVRANRLTGVGLVVGLDGTGDDASSPLVRNGLAAMVKRLDITIDAAQIKAKNVAAVVITAELPPFARPGQALDVTVSSMGTAKSLAGGTLLATPLKGPDLRTWALAQGSLAVGGFLAEGDGASQRKNHVTVAQLPGGALVEKGAPTPMPRGELVLILRRPDFTTATRTAAAIVAALGADAAQARDAGSVVVPIGPAWRDQVPALIARIEALEVEPDAPARIVIDERTGGIVFGGAVRLQPGAIAYGGLNVTISEKPRVSQPRGRAGKTTTVPRTQVEVTEGAGPLHALPAAATLTDVVGALGALGVKPRDLIAIVRLLAASGVLRAEVVVQ